MSGMPGFCLKPSMYRANSSIGEKAVSLDDQCQFPLQLSTWALSELKWCALVCSLVHIIRFAFQTILGNIIHFNDLETSIELPFQILLNLDTSHSFGWAEGKDILSAYPALSDTHPSFYAFCQLKIKEHSTVGLEFWLYWHINAYLGNYLLNNLYRICSYI